MSSYFKPLRRKLGIATLLLACVFTAGWIRGAFICDIADFGGRGGSQRFYASCDGLMWFWFEGYSNATYGKAFEYQQCLTANTVSPHPAGDILWYWHWGGFHFSKSIPIINNGSMPYTMWVVPYWCIVIPLTLLSAWLLLSKPRQRQMQVEPVTEKAA